MLRSSLGVFAMCRLVVFLFLSFVTSQAWAGSVASYRNDADGSTLTVEVSDQAARLEYSNQPFYLISRNNEAFVVYKTTPETVLRISDAERVFQEFRPKISFEHGAIDRMKLVERGSATIATFSGRAYYLETPAGVSSRPALVVSTDPRLSAVGALLARQFDFSITTVRLSGQQVPPNILLLREKIGSGTALAFAGYRLTSMKSAEPGAGRFDLPAAPVPIEQLRVNAAQVLQKQ